VRKREGKGLFFEESFDMETKKGARSCSSRFFLNLP